MGIWERVPPTISSTRCATSSASTRRASTASTPSTRSGRCATAGPRCSSGWAATSSPPSPTPRSPRRRCATRGPHRPRLDQAQPLPRRHRPRGADPAGARPQRARPHRRAASSGSPSRTRCPRSTPRTGRWSRPRAHLRSEVDIVCCLALATLGAEHPVPWAALRDDYAEIRRADRPGGARLCGVRREGRPARRLRAARTRRATPAPSRPGGQGGVHGQPDRRARRSPRGGCCCRRCARTTSSTPRSTGSTTATAASTAAGAWCSCTPTTSSHLGFADGDLVDLVSEWTDGVGAPGARVPDRRPTTSRGAAPPPTTPRPTRWSRSIHSPRAATVRRRSR